MRRSSLVARRSSLVARRSSLVARRSSLVALAALVVVVATDTREAAASPIWANSQLATTQSDVAGNKWSVWTRNVDGMVMARRELQGGRTVWYNYGPPTPTVHCNFRGVTATSYVSGGHVYEHVFCQDTLTNPSIRELRLIDGVSQGWRDLNLGTFGPKHEMVATSILVAGHWNVFVFFTTYATALGVAYYDATTPGILNIAQIGNAHSQTSQLAASRAPGASPGYLHLFAARQDGTVDVWRWDSGGLSNAWNIGRPQGGVDAMGTAVAVEDQIAPGSYNYRVFLFCTAQAQNNKLYLAWADSAAAGDNFTWANYSLQDGSNFQNSGYAIAATSRSDGQSNRAIEAVALATQGNYPPERIWRVRYASGGFSGIADIGLDGETWRRTGGLAAYPRTGRSAVLFLGAGSDSNAERLYLKDGTDANPAYPENWANHGDGAPRSTLTSEPIGETSAAYFDGRAIVAGISHPGTGGPEDFSTVKTLWSWSDGDSWEPAWVELPLAEGLHNVSSDPTVDFDENGKAYVSLVAAHVGETCEPGDSRHHSQILLYTTDDGTYPDPPTRVDLLDERNLDHPFMAIHRDPVGNEDRLHIVWADMAVWYSSMPIPGVLGEVYPLFFEPAVGPPYLTVGAEGAVYVVTDHNYWICRVNDTFDDCADNPSQIPENLRPQGEDIRLNDGTDDVFKPGSFALVASTTDPDVVYWAFQRREGDDDPQSDQTDVYVSTGMYTQGGAPFDWLPPVLVGEYEDDDADQFAPSIGVSQQMGADNTLVSVTWHERHGGTCDLFPNHCFKVRRSISFTNGLGFQYPQTIPIDSGDSWSDPAELPVSCLGTLNNHHEHFLGHYRTVRGDLFHFSHVITGSPNGGSTENEARLCAGWISGGFYYWQQ